MMNYTIRKTENGVRHDTIQRLHLLSKFQTVLQYMCKYNLIYTHKKSTASPAPIFTKSTTSEQHHMQISYQISSKLGNMWKVQTIIHFCLQMMYSYQCAHIHKTNQTLNKFCGKLCSKFYPKLMKNMKKQPQCNFMTKISCESEGA